VALSQL